MRISSEEMEELAEYYDKYMSKKIECDRLRKENADLKQELESLKRDKHELEQTYLESRNTLTEKYTKILDQEREIREFELTHPGRKYSDSWSGGK